MRVRWNNWPFSSLGLTMQSASPLRQRLVRHLLLAFVFVKTCACLAAEHPLVAQPEQNSWDVITLPISFFEGITDINGDIHADLIDQSQRTHRHSPCHQRAVDPLPVHADLEK